MLAAENRMRRSAQFDLAFRGVRGRGNRVALFIGAAQSENVADLPPVKVGFVIPKSVGNSVVRHRLARQLRHIMRTHIENGDLHPGEMVAVRAFPPAKGTSSAELSADISKALRTCREKQGAKELQASSRENTATEGGR